MKRIIQVVRRAGRFAVVAGRTCRYLWTVRVILAIAMVVKCFPLDMGIDEALTAIAVVVLNRMRPGLMKACYQAAKIRA